LGWNVCLQLSSIPFFLQVLFKIKQSDFKLNLIAPAWPKQAWIPELLLLSCAKPLVQKGESLVI
jgi:hypothetical protein